MAKGRGIEPLSLDLETVILSLKYPNTCFRSEFMSISERLVNKKQ